MATKVPTEVPTKVGTEVPVMERRDFSPGDVVRGRE